MAGGLGILQTPYPLTRPPPPPAQGKEDRKQSSTRPLERSPPSAFRSPIHRPPRKKIHVNTIPTPWGGHSRPEVPRTGGRGIYLVRFFLLTHFPQAPNPPFPLQNPAQQPTPTASAPNRIRCPRGGGRPRAVPVTNLLL